MTTAELLDTPRFHRVTLCEALGVSAEWLDRVRRDDVSPLRARPAGQPFTLTDALALSIMHQLCAAGLAHKPAAQVAAWMAPQYLRKRSGHEHLVGVVIVPPSDHAAEMVIEAPGQLALRLSLERETGAVLFHVLDLERMTEALLETIAQLRSRTDGDDAEPFEIGDERNA